MKRRGIKGRVPPQWGWMLFFGIAGAALYGADVFGVRSKVVEPAIMKAKSVGA